MVVIAIVVVIAPLFIMIAMRVASFIGLAIFIMFPMVMLLLVVLTILPAHFVIFVAVIVALIAVVIVMVLLGHYAVVVISVFGNSGCHAKAADRHDDRHGS